MEPVIEKTANVSSLELYFRKYREGIVGINQEYESPHGTRKIVYADWTASGRLYRPIEEKMLHDFGPFVANTHTETTVSGTVMTLAYKKARTIIKQHVNAGENDILIATGTGMTGTINKFQRILGLKIAENLEKYTTVPDEKRPVVFISHMEHHSNHTSWLETIAEVVVVPPAEDGLFSMENFEKLLEEYKHYPLKMASVTACSNVTGLPTPYHDIAKMIHHYGGVCFVDFACSGPYVKIDMHPDKESYLDAIFLSPHKFLGGPGTSGILIFNKDFDKNQSPDHPGGGTVRWTSPWGLHLYIDNLEDREDGGTPGFLQLIKTALAVQLKEEMGVENILSREHEILSKVFTAFSKIPNLHILAGQHEDRLGVVSFYIDGLHYNLGVKILNDRFGIQTRGGCSCAGTYGHYLLHIDQEKSNILSDEIQHGMLVDKPGWIRMSIHPTTTDEELQYMIESIKSLAGNFEEWAQDYDYIKNSNEFKCKETSTFEANLVNSWFK